MGRVAVPSVEVRLSPLLSDKDIKKAMDLGAKEYLIKSNFTLEELVEKVKKIA
jgi:DNA-binding NarL/FixJ family response regulator